MLYGLPPNLCCFVVPGLGKTPKAGLKNTTGVSAQKEPKVGQESKAGGSVLTGSTQLPSAEPRLCTQPWSAICSKLLLEYVIIPIAAQICPKFLKKQINDTVHSAIEIIDQLKYGEMKNSSGHLKVAYLHNLIEDLNLYTSDPLRKDTTESFVKEFLNKKFGAVPNEEFDEEKLISKIQAIDNFNNEIIKMKAAVESQENTEEGWFFESLFQPLKELKTEAQNSIYCNDSLNQPKDSGQERKERQNQATFAQIFRGEVQYCDDD
ncbi:hypothetical protein KTQ42_16500|uniref:hypothetical protein n=1 Tax=Noviherbaspirillum sp. L7-7A TaxID=2850560 RepID=UPI001C2BEFE1|nr:hypothetical protein [Noviherbaspirillum sp. L7-7A]MBV0880900.1 hypothetical protein [Noviherbaspirillum sp. L7-7A]